MKLWEKIDDDYYELAPLTHKDIENAERLFQKKLPEKYIELLYQQNGGMIQFNAHPLPLPNDLGENHIYIDHMMGIGTENGILQTPLFLKEWEMPNNLILLYGDGHTWIALDYRKTNDNPPVVYVDNEYNQIIEIADSFNNFIGNLYIEEISLEEEEIVVIGGKEDWTPKEISQALSSNEELQICYALDYLYTNPKPFTSTIEQSLIALLQSPDPDLKVIGANYAYHFNEEGILTPEFIERIISILNKDPEIKYYVEMFFSKS